MQIQHYLNNIKDKLELHQVEDIINEYNLRHPEAQVRFFFIKSKCKISLGVIAEYVGLCDLSVNFRLSDLTIACWLEGSKQGNLSLLLIASVSVNKVITIITPFMLRVHQLVPRSGELISISLSPKINRFGTKLLSLTTHSSLGALPLGLIIVQQSEESSGIKDNILLEILEEFNDHLTSEKFFYGNKFQFRD